MSFDSYIAECKQRLDFEDNPDDYWKNKELEESELWNVLNPLQSLELVRENLYDEIISEGELKKEYQSAALAIEDLEKHGSKILSKYFEEKLGKPLEDVNAKRGRAYLRDLDDKSAEFEAYRVIRDNWVENSDVIMGDEKPLTFS